MSILTTDQIKGKIKCLSKENGSDARLLIRLYMMERFLERISLSKYKNCFIIKGGILVTSMIGVNLRSTMDVDTSITGFDLSNEMIRCILEEISNIDVDDGVDFEIKDVSKIMDEHEYPGIRVRIDAKAEKLITPFKIDISTGDAITPKAIEYQYKTLFDNRYISLLSYNVETVLAEKLQTILARGILNTRMRNFYDIYVLLGIYKNDIDERVLKMAFEATCRNRNSENLKIKGNEIIETISADISLKNLWKNYRNKYPYAKNISFEDVIRAVQNAFSKIK